MRKKPKPLNVAWEVGFEFSIEPPPRKDERLARREGILPLPSANEEETQATQRGLGGRIFLLFFL